MQRLRLIEGYLFRLLDAGRDSGHARNTMCGRVRSHPALDCKEGEEQAQHGAKKRRRPPILASVSTPPRHAP